MAEGEAEELPWVSGGHLEQIVAQIADGRALGGGELAGYRYPPEIAQLLIDHSVEANVEEVHLEGQIEGDLIVDRNDSISIVIDHVAGSIAITDGVTVSTLVIRGAVLGDVSIGGEVVGGLYIGKSGVVSGDLAVKGVVSGGSDVQGTVSGHVSIDGTVDSFRVSGAVVGGLSVPGEVSGDLRVYGTVEKHLSHYGVICGDLRIAPFATVERLLYVKGEVAGDLDVSGAVKGKLLVDRRAVVRGDLRVDGVIDDGVSVRGEVKRRCVLVGSANQPLTLVSVNGARFGDEVFVGDFVSIERCDLRGCPDLQRLNFSGSFVHLFPTGRGLLNDAMNKSPDELAVINRRLRANLEGRRNRPASNVFYRGEMDARRRAAASTIVRRSQRLSEVTGSRDGEEIPGDDSESKSSEQRPRWSEWIILSGYNLISGYGLQAWKAMVWFGMVAVLGTVLFAVSGVDLDDGPGGSTATLAEVTVFTFRSMIAFFNPPSADLTVPQEWLQIGLRFAGPVLLAQAILAVRERVAR